MKDAKYFTKPPLDELAEGQGSGRTRRMLQRALATALQGQTVFIVIATDSHRPWMMQQMQQLPEMRPLFNVHISYQSGDIQLPSGQLRFRSAESPDWDWTRGQFRGYPAGVPIFIDHDAWHHELNKRQEKKDATSDK